MATTADAAPSRRLGRATAARLVVALTVILTVVAVGLISAVDASASTPTAIRAQNAVAVIHIGDGQVVGAHQPVLAGQDRARAPDYDPTAVGSSVAAETSGGGGDGLTQLFRATDSAETADISGLSAYRTLASQEGKYFFANESQATNIVNDALAKTESMAGQYSLTSGLVPTSLLDQFVVTESAGEGPAYFVPEEFLPRFTNVQIHGPIP